MLPEVGMNLLPGVSVALGVSTDGGDGRGLSCGSSSISRAIRRAVPSLHQEMSGTIRCSAIFGVPCILLHVRVVRIMYDVSVFWVQRLWTTVL